MRQDIAKRGAEGAVAGIAGTFLLQGVMLGMQQFFPQAETPEAEDPASFMLWQVEKRLPKKVWMRIPPTAEQVAGIGLSLAYGAAFGAIYGAVRPKRGCVWVDGAVLGTAVWAVGYLGWLPAAGLIPPIWKQTPVQTVGPIIEHLAYGFATVAAYDLLVRKW